MIDISRRSLVVAALVLAKPCAAQAEHGSETGATAAAVCSVGGVVRGPLGDPLTGLRVRLVEDVGEEAVTTALTDPSGRYYMDGIAPITGWVVAERQGLTTCRAFVKVTRDKPRAAASLQLWEGVTVRGTVRDRAGKPVENADVLVVNDRLSDPSVVNPQVRTDAEGRYEARGVPLFAVSDARRNVVEDVDLVFRFE